MPQDADSLSQPAGTESEYGMKTVTLTGFEAVESPQREPVWCWAACASMILRYNGIDVSQEEIVDRVHGYLPDGSLKVATASRFELLRALAPDAPPFDFDSAWKVIQSTLEDAGTQALDKLKGEGKVEGDIDLSWNEDEAVQSLFDRIYPSSGVPIAQLQLGDPAVAGLRDPDTDQGHLYVIVGAQWEVKRPGLGDALIDYAKTGLGTGELSKLLVDRFEPSGIAVQSIELVDPLRKDDPETEVNEARVSLTFKEFKSRVDFVTTRADAHEILTRWWRLIELEVE
ncbi:hypothetical protein Pla86_03810 [Planctomycetes bacterium Pla86]|uniref:Peptidase C39-like domain-containing protein n=1 Tax=Engelhardtia mirabilis TaxID=2528011 RepID=A0A518BEC2_9BACT|nr:hypothetical protein Pla133_03810 [Planctomycetes bacterium Pla133]QDU99642.1 hypothetical protein Pla86_03810 [Planctomycetes bacterium Pla86]